MLIAGHNVFPLVHHSNLLAGYFMDKDGNVFSNKSPNTSGNLTRLMGSRQPSGHYYTLNKRTYRADDLVHAAERHMRFTAETQSMQEALANALPPASAAAAQLPLGRTKSAKAAVAHKGYVLATVGPTDRFVFGTDPVLHTTETTAREEAARIATLKPGTEVVILKAVASVTAGATVWK